MADILSDLIASMKDNIASVDKDGMISSVVSFFFFFLHLCFLLLLLSLNKWYFLYCNIHLHIFPLRHIYFLNGFQRKICLTIFACIIFTPRKCFESIAFEKKNSGKAKFM